MTVQTAIAAEAPTKTDAAPLARAPVAEELLARALEPFQPMADAYADLAHAIDALERTGGRPVAATARRLKRMLRRTEPSITMIGQVKAGKTSLVNAMVGQPGLLPADVNPWTSVVTSLHLSPEPAADGVEAVFRFFEADQWQRLMKNGGRIGELAGRAGAEDEVARVTAQLEAMRKKSMRRLGSQFELLMGQEHRYATVDSGLVERYVCLGDEPGEGDDPDGQGRFADITRSADLHLHRPEMPVALCLRDTPGVNDTFLMREQITIQAIRDSRTCVVVLSAHQALNAVDLALIRLIANIPSRDVVIFVNRIDELSDPGAHVGEIEESIRQTIHDHRGPSEAEIVFGSALWAGHAIADTLHEMDAQSEAALLSWAEAECGDLPKGADGRYDRAAVWELSGVTGLYGALADRVAETVGAEVADEVARGGLNLVTRLDTETRVRPRAIGAVATAPIERAALLPEIDGIEARMAARLADGFERIVADFHQRLDRAQAGFVDRAVAALTRHLEQEGEGAVWTYDPTGLRILLRSAFTVYSTRAAKLIREVYGEAAAEIAGLYVRGFELDPGSAALVPPPVPQLAPPVILGETIALDLKAGWWSRFWNRRQGYGAYAAGMSDLIAAECARMVEAVKAEYGAPDRARAEAALREFIGGQRKTLVDLWMRDEVSAEEVAERVAGPGAGDRAATLAAARDTFTLYLGEDFGSTEAA
ncbi:MAG: dynamin family protein [Paracoccaceae bacterium]|jgi:hypothetical protein|nr:dynamin family protein [Paracoccaceae bacterium]